MRCEYCGSKFKSGATLLRHQKYAKYCLKQRKHEEVFVCCCKKKYFTQEKLETHQIKCVSYIKNNYEQKILDIVENYEQKIKNLQDRYDNLAMNKKTTVINTQNNINVDGLLPMTEWSLITAADNLTMENIKDGVDGYIAHAVTHSFKDRLLCTDVSRQKFVYKDVDGGGVADYCLEETMKKYCQSIKDQNKDLINKYNQELEKKLDKETYIQMMPELYKQLRSINDGAKLFIKFRHHL